MGDGGLMEPALEIAIEKMVEREFKRANKRVIAEARVTAKKETTLHCIRCLMTKLNLTAQEAMDILDVHANKQKEYLALILDNKS